MTPILHELPGIDKRRAKRIPYKRKATFKPQWRTNQDCLIRDVSLKGAYLVAQQQLFEKAEVLIYLPIVTKDGQNTYVVSGHVARVEKKEGHKVFGYGIQFDKLSSTMEAQLKKFLEKRHKEDTAEQELPATD